MRRLALITILALAGIVAACSPAKPSANPGSTLAPVPSTEPSLAPSTEPSPSTAP